MGRGAAIAAMLIVACGGAAPASTIPTATPEPATPTPTAAAATAAPTATASPTPRPTPERTVTLVGTLAAKVSDQERTTSGAVRIVLQLERGPAGEVLSATAQVDFSLQGLPADARVQFAHIHLGTADVEGPILLDSGLTAARFRFTNGAGSVSLPAVPCDAKLAAEILANPSGYHFMVHSARNPDGFVRGQLRRG